MATPTKLTPIDVFKADGPAPADSPATRVVPPDTLIGAPPPADAAPASAPLSAGSPAPAEEVVAKPVHSSSVAIIRTLTLVLKLSISGAILLIGTYVTVKSVVPVIKELRNPNKPGAAPDKEAPTFVKAIQQTRQVVAKNDANVAYLDSVIGLEPKAAANPFAPAALQPATPPPLVAVKAPDPAPPPAPVKVTTYAPSPPVVVEVRSSSAPISDAKLRLYNNTIADLKIGGVLGGPSPRILVDGLIVKLGDIVDPRLKLKFTGVDQEKHLVFFKNEDQVIFQRSY